MYPLKYALPFFLASVLTSNLSAQKKNEAYQLHIHKATSPVKIDGVMDEKAWMDAETATNFYMVLPMDTSFAKVRTDVKMTYDDHNLYLIAICYNAIAGPYYVESLRRDFTFGKNDNFLVFIDTFDDQTNGFSFGANAAGAEWDGQQADGGFVDLSWESRWTSAVKNYNDKWVFEMAVPFKSIRYKKGITRWGINFSRLDLKMAEKSSWAPVPRQFQTAALAYAGVLLWDQPPPAASTNISFIPYALTRLNKSYESNSPNDYTTAVGGDMKLAVSSSLNIDLTINPDFSQVEVDKQVTNLSRYELFFPEKRQFFLENADLFSNFGYPSIRPFFSRRIGLGVPIRYGLKLSGKPNRDWRIGFMNIETGKVNELGLPAQNFSVVSLQRRIFFRSNIRLLFINKESINYNDVKDSLYSRFNRNIGLEYNLASVNNVWTGKLMGIKSFSPGSKGKDWVFAGHIKYASKRLSLYWQNEYVGANYTAEVGYVPRSSYILVNPQLSYLFFPKEGIVLSHGPTFSSFNYFNESFSRTDETQNLSYITTFRNSSKFIAWVAHDYVKLLRPFDPTVSGKDTLPTGSKHRWDSWGTEFDSKPNSLFLFVLTSRYGGYYAGGNRLNLTADVGYRFQPYVAITVSTNYNNIDLPAPWGRTIYWLVGPRFDVTMTNKLFFTAFIQYNNQTENINVNTKLQWRYKPASDLYLVYTDNYLPAPFSVRSRALVLKMTYWWNL